MQYLLRWSPSHLGSSLSWNLLPCGGTGSSSLFFSCLLLNLPSLELHFDLEVVYRLSLHHHQIQKHLMLKGSYSESSLLFTYLLGFLNTRIQEVWYFLNHFQMLRCGYLTSFYELKHKHDYHSLLRWTLLRSKRWIWGFSWVSVRSLKWVSWLQSKWWILLHHRWPQFVIQYPMNQCVLPSTEFHLVSLNLWFRKQHYLSLHFQLIYFPLVSVELFFVPDFAFFASFLHLQQLCMQLEWLLLSDCQYGPNRLRKELLILLILPKLHREKHFQLHSICNLKTRHKSSIIDYRLQFYLWLHSSCVRVIRKIELL